MTIPSKPGVISVAGHGNEWWVVDPNEEGITAGTMADLIRKNPKFAKAKAVEFYVCDVGAGEYLQEVANYTGKTARAPNTHLWTYSRSSPTINYPRVDNPNLPDLKRPGQWVTATPLP